MRGKRTGLGPSITASMVFAVGLPGCAVVEVQRSLDETNTTLVLIQEDLAALRTSTERIARMDGELARMQEELSALRETTARIARIDAEIDAGIAQLDSVGTSLVEMDGQLNTVSGSLRDLDLHLASLRRTMQQLNKIVPFVKIADDAPIKAPDGE